MTFDPFAYRAQFPALQNTDQIYLDNAGGSQCLGVVASAVKEYLDRTNVQLGASYDTGRKSNEIHDRGLKAAAEFIGAEKEEIVIGPSTTQLFSNLSLILNLPPDSELVISSLDHEANIAPWVRLAEWKNYTIKWWPRDPSEPLDPNKAKETSPKHTAENLRPLLSEKTRLICCTHASNILGTIHDIRSIAREVHTVPGAKLCVDGVALAPHREVNVKELEVDFYSFSWYKVYGPHLAILYASSHTHSSLSTLGHFFHPPTSLTNRLGLAASSYELVAALPALASYFKPSKSTFFASSADHEEALSRTLLSYLRSKPELFTVYGSPDEDKDVRVPVLSFTVEGKGSKEVVEAVEGRSKYGIRWGSFYSKRLVEGVLGLGEEGVVRCSAVHYNTVEEIEGLVKVLDELVKEWKLL